MMRMLVALCVAIAGMSVAGAPASAASSACTSCKDQAYDRCREAKARNYWTEAEFKDCLKLGRKNCGPYCLILTKPLPKPGA